MGVCKSRDYDQESLPLVSSKDQSMEPVSVEVPPQGLDALLRKMSETQLSPMLQMTLLTKLRVVAPTSDPKKRSPSKSLIRKSTGSYHISRPSSYPSNLGDLALTSKYTPSCSRNGNSDEFDWEALSTTLYSESAKTPVSIRRSLSSLLRDFVEEEQIMLGTLFGQICSPRARPSSKCIFE